MTTTIINLLAGPGAGKSTTAAGLFHRMKLLNYKVELVTEYAKELVYADRERILANDQLYVFAKQNHRLANCVGKVDYVITDSCLLFSNVYADYMSPTFQALVVETYRRYHNLDFYIQRPQSYQEYGRVHTHDQALEIDYKIETLIRRLSIEPIRLQASESTVDQLLEHVATYHQLTSKLRTDK